MSDTKVCSKCKNEKSLDKFANHAKRPDGKQSCCNECLREYDRIRRLNPLRLAYERLRGRERWQNMSDEEKAKKNEKQREYDRNRWRNDEEFRNKKKEKDKGRIRVFTDAQKKNQYATRVRYLKDNPKKREEYRMRDKIGVHNRKAKSLGLEYGLTIEEWNEIVKELNSECFYCGNYTPLPEIEHKIPTGRGGGNIKSNVTMACPTCNTKKQQRTAEEFIAYMRANPGEYFYVKTFR